MQFSTFLKVMSSLALPKHLLNDIIPLLIQFMKLIVFYLGIKLPFTIGGSLIKPLIKATNGNSNAAKYPKSYPLYSSSGSSSSTDKASSASLDTAVNTSLADPPSSSPSNAATAASHSQALSIGLKMLAYNARYLLHVSEGLDTSHQVEQADEDPLDILSTLVRVCRSLSVGMRSHRMFNSPDALLDTEWPGRDFASFLKDLEKRSNQIAGNGVTGKSRGTYVVIDGKSKGIEKVKREDSMDPFVVKDEEGWDIL